MSIYSSSSGLYLGKISSNRSTPSTSLFIRGEIFIGYSQFIDRSGKVTFLVQSAIELNGTCSALFVDWTRIIFCTLTDEHRVITFSVDRRSQRGEDSFGDGSCGSTSTQLCFPTGIHLNVNSDLYVADTNNDRIQLFRNRSEEGTTVLGGTSNVITTLSRPTAVIIDLRQTLFVVDSYNHRIIQYFWTGWKCLIGCDSQTGLTNSELAFPTHLAFDYEGNLFVLDRGNRRIQKYQLERNTCCKWK